MRSYSAIANLIMLFAACLILSACEKPLENPEQVDLIYIDLNKRLSEAKSNKEKAVKDIEEKSKQLTDTKLGFFEKKLLLRQRGAASFQLRQAEQQVLFLEIQVAKRIDFAKREYPKRYASKSEWPDKAEFKAYQASNRLESASPNWSDRVPKSKYRKPSSSSGTPSKEKPKEGQGGGGGHGEKPAATEGAAPAKH